MNDFLKALCPTVATALMGPMGLVAVAGLGKILGLDDATAQSVSKAITGGQLTPEHIEKIKQMELDYQDNEKERDFKYAELAFKDVDSARQMQIATHSQMPAVLTTMVTIKWKHPVSCCLRG